MARSPRSWILVVAAALIATGCDNPFAPRAGSGGGGGYAGPSASDATGLPPAPQPSGLSTADSLIRDSDVAVAYSSPETKAHWNVSTATGVAYYSPRGDGRIRLSWSPPPEWWHPNTTITLTMTSAVEAEPVGPVGSKVYIGVTDGADWLLPKYDQTSYAGRASSGAMVPGDTKVNRFTLKPTNGGQTQRITIGLEYGPTITYLYKK